MKKAATATVIACLFGAAALAAPGTPLDVAAIVADTSRPAADRALDSSRHPAELLAFLHIRKGDTVADVWPGDYWDRLFADAVGPTGRVYAVHLAEADKFEHHVTPPEGSMPLPEHPNVIATVSHANTLSLPTRADVIWIRQNYHDLYDPFMGPADVAAFDKAVYRALKPGGRFVVIDHAAPDGSKLADTNTTHRIDAAVVKADMAAAGFKFVGESNVLRNPADPRTKLVFDPSIRGHTDQFVYVFRRP
ncbi:MAG: class I SAM-dependent methyltransferase [Porphyrobacter sp.]|nr:class I SAM-dependent methyltransferase [Porphyrobacter sp.]